MILTIILICAGCGYFLHTVTYKPDNRLENELRMSIGLHEARKRYEAKHGKPKELDFSLPPKDWGELTKDDTYRALWKTMLKNKE